MSNNKKSVVYKNVAKAIVVTLAMFGYQLCFAEQPDVMLTESIPAVTISHQGTLIKVERIQDTNNKLVDDFAKTSRPCPPFCIHPMMSAPGVETIGELELLDFLNNEVATQKGLVVDARMTNWYDSETIPGSVNIPFVMFTTPSQKRDKIFTLLGADQNTDGNFDFSNAVRLALFCNGPWCDQSPRAIKALIGAGYPANKLLYYRGGMQSWKMFGLTTVLPKSNEASE